MKEGPSEWTEPLRVRETGDKMAITPRPKDRKLRQLVRKLHQERNTLAHRVSQAKLELARESAEPEKYRAALAACVEAMRLWGSEEDGIPADGPIAEAYDRAIQLLDCASAFAAARRGSPFGLDDPTRLAEPFCACGRVVSQCDRSRRNCGKRKATP